MTKFAMSSWRRSGRSLPERQLRVRACAGIAALLCLSGCSLISLKSPERPLSTRDLNARILTRQYATDFIIAVEQCADDIALHEADPKVQRASLRWKIAATTQSLHAANQLVPMMAALDTWTLAAGMKTFLSADGPGGALFGGSQLTAWNLANRLEATAALLVQQVAPPREYQEYRQFVTDYTREHPLQDLQFVRPSVVELWARRRGGADFRLVDSLGTIPEALADASERVQMYSETLPSQTMWRTQLALQVSGAGDDIRVALQKLDERSAHMAATADAAPQLVHDALADVRKIVIEAMTQLDASSAATIEALRAERVALSASLSNERAAVLTAADTQRKAIAVDAAGIADRVVTSSGQQLRYLARELMLLFILLAVVTLGLPFAAGYFVGRIHQPNKKLQP